MIEEEEEERGEKFRKRCVFECFGKEKGSLLPLGRSTTTLTPPTKKKGEGRGVGVQPRWWKRRVFSSRALPLKDSVMVCQRRRRREEKSKGSRTPRRA